MSEQISELQELVTVLSNKVFDLTKRLQVLEQTVHEIDPRPSQHKRATERQLNFAMTILNTLGLDPKDPGNKFEDMDRIVMSKWIDDHLPAYRNKTAPTKRLQQQGGAF